MNDAIARPPPGSSRRTWIAAAAVGAAAAAAGAGVAWWRLHAGQADAGALDALWALDVRTPEGEPLAMGAFRGRPLLVNFWATWCPPCVEEMPLLDAFFRQHVANGWQVVGLAIDQPAAVQAFLQRRPVAFPVGLAGLQGTSLTRKLGNDAGGLPFSVLIGADGRLRERRIGRLGEADLRAWSSRA